ncbi:MAG: hypothetical protein RL088_1802 [Verrucomicrobiota bacterium]|jgi:hypothetical protein
MRLLVFFLVLLSVNVRANHPANILDSDDDYTPVLQFAESVKQIVTGTGEDRATVDNYTGSFRISVGSESLASLTGASVVRLRIGSFLLDTTLGTAADYVAGGNKATFDILEGTDRIGSVKAKWSGGKITIIGSIRANFIPSPEHTFHIPQLTEDERRFISEASDASLTFGEVSGLRRIEVKGKSTFKSFRIGTVDDPVFEDDLWSVSVAGTLDFKPPKIKLLVPKRKTNATPQAYILSTPPDVDSITVQLNTGTASDPVLRDPGDPPFAKPVVRLWDGLLYLEAGANTVTFTAVDRSGNSSSQSFTLTHDWRTGTYSGILDTGTDDMTRTLTITVRDGGAFTGTMLLGQEKFRLKGAFDATGNVTLFPPRKSGTPPEIQLSLTQDDSEFTGEPDPKPTILTATINDTVGTYTIDASRSVFDTAGITPALAAGYYTARIEPDPLLDGTGAPEGTGFLSLKIAPTGLVRVLGKVADGTAFSLSVPLGGDARVLVYSRLYSPADGFVQGFITITPDVENGDTCQGSLRWVQPFGATKATGLFPDGFSAECPVSGGIYIPGYRTFDGEFFEEFPALGYTEALLSLVKGEFGDAALEQEFDITYKSAVHLISADPAEKLKLTVKNQTGFFSGSLNAAGHTSPAKKFFGAIIGQEGVGEGFFTSKTDSGAVSIIAR